MVFAEDAYGPLTQFDAPICEPDSHPMFRKTVTLSDLALDEMEAIYIRAQRNGIMVANLCEWWMTTIYVLSTHSNNKYGHNGLIVTNGYGNRRIKKTPTHL